MISFLIIILGLCVFEIISSVDNAIVNAHVLKTLPEKYRKIFLTWGIFFAVFAIRGLLPFIIVWIANPGLSPVEVFTFVFQNNPEIETYVNQSRHYLLLGGGAYLFLIFLSWLFLEEKKYAFLVEGFIHRRGVWFYALASIFLTVVVYAAIQTNPLLALAATIGTTAFFLTDGFRKNAEAKEKELLSGNMSAWQDKEAATYDSVPLAIELRMSCSSVSLAVRSFFCARNLSRAVAAFCFICRDTCLRPATAVS